MQVEHFSLIGGNIMEDILEALVNARACEIEYVILENIFINKDDYEEHIFFYKSNICPIDKSLIWLELLRGIVYRKINSTPSKI